MVGDEQEGNEISENGTRTLLKSVTHEVGNEFFNFLYNGRSPISRKILNLVFKYRRI